MIVGIVGHEAAKFTVETEVKAKAIIAEILTKPGVTGYSSGHCHLGGIDIWTEEIGDELGLDRFVFPARDYKWDTGFKPRNIQIAKASGEVHCVVVFQLPPTYTGMKFKLCYHCDRVDHIKSGGCWTAKYAESLGKPAFWHIVR